MKAELLTVVAVLNNPMRWVSRLKHFRNLETHLLAAGVRVVTVECAYGARPFELEDRVGIQRVRVRAKSVLWQKENLINLGFLHAGDWEYGMWIDGDSHLVRPDWAVETVQALQLHKVVQVSSELLFLGPHHQTLSTAPSLLALYQDHLGAAQLDSEGCAPYAVASLAWLKRHGYPGMAWAYRREAFDALGGLIDFCVVGSGDWHMARALLDLPDAAAQRGSPRYAQLIAAWRDRATRHVARHVGLVRGPAVHFFHGKYAKRRYDNRAYILERNAFDPDTDICRDAQGLLQLTGNKPQLRDDLLVYAEGRDEDSTEL